MNRIRACLVGCGRISELHTLGYKDNPDAEIYAVCDSNYKKARKAAKKWGVERIYRNYNDVLEDPMVDLIELLVPHHLHCEMTIQACRAGKHISVQKPMALDLKEADLMIEAAEKAGVKLKVYENFIFYPPYIKARELLERGEIGTPISIRIKLNPSGKGGWEIPLSSWAWRMQDKKSGGGVVVFDDGYHKFSIARYLLGEVEKVAAWIDSTTVIPGLASVDAPGVIMWKYKDKRKYGIMDITYSKDLEMDSDYYACDERVEITGSKGVLWVTRCTAKMLELPTLVVFKEGKTRSYEGLRDDWSDSFIDSTQDFIDAIKEDRDPILNGREGREVLKFALAVLKSAEKNKEIYLDKM